MVSKQILRTIPFSGLSVWSVDSAIASSISSRYPMEPLGKVLHRVKTPVLIQDHLSYRRITVKLYGKGVVQRDEVPGSEIGTKRQFRASAGQLILSRIDARNGAFGIVPEELDGAIVTNDFWLFDMCNINPDFIMLVLSSEQFQKYWQVQSSGTTNRQRIGEKDFLTAEIPMPPLREQNRLIQVYRSNIHAAKQLEQRAEKLEQEIDEYLCAALDITSVNASPMLHTGLLKRVSRKNMIGWGVQMNCNPVKPREIFHSNSYKNLPIERYCELNPTTSIPDSAEEVSFVPMECVSDTFGEIAEYRLGKASSTKGYTKFKENDVLWAKITPCMQNGKCALANNLKNGYGFGSTEFHVFRANETILPEFLYCLLRTKRLREVAMTYFTGSAGQQRVSGNFLEALTIPQIPITSKVPEDITQEKIVGHIFELKQEVKETYLRMDYLRAEAKREFEGAVFGET